MHIPFILTYIINNYNKTADKTASQNYHIICKWRLNILKLAGPSLSIKKLLLKNKYFATGLHTVKVLEEILNI